MLAILFALMAAATDAPPPPPMPAAAAPITGTPGVSRPASIGAPHVCAEIQYPVSALQTGTEGRTLMQFTITSDGHVADISLRTSSGNADLDAAAMTCARDWLYQPAMQDATPVAVPWVAEVLWRIGVEEPYSALPGAARDCLRADSVSWDEMKAAQLRPVVRVHFANGVMTDVVVAGSSGDTDLDSRTLACYRSLPPELTANIPDGDSLLVIMKPNE
jgi:TonB family protein